MTYVFKDLRKVEKVWMCLDVFGDVLVECLQT